VVLIVWRLSPVVNEAIMLKLDQLSTILRYEPVTIPEWPSHMFKLELEAFRPWRAEHLEGSFEGQLFLHPGKLLFEECPDIARIDFTVR
jgi:hypothetical protein